MSPKIPEDVSIFLDYEARNSIGPYQERAEQKM